MSQRHRVVYIAGPFRGPDHWAIEENIRKAEAMALDVWKAGATALCPHLNTRHFQGALPDNVWMRGDIELLKRCDAVLMVPGWERSLGATSERFVAESRRMPVFYDLLSLTAWLGRRDEA